jgi:6-phosphogluconolactonase (cycloisomerase 2 family)
MKGAILLSVLAGAVAFAAAAHAQSGAGTPKSATASVVFVQTNEPAGNNIVVYDRAGDGQLTRAGTYATGGNGGVAAPGTESDHLASQGSLAYDAADGLLIAVNAGSDSVSTFSVHGDLLRLEGVVSSGGQFPASIAVHGRLVYVLNSGGSGIVQGFRIADDRLVRIPGSDRTLGLANTDPPFFLSSPGQIGFTPDGRQVLVTTKASGGLIDAFQVRPDGRLSATPTANPSATPVPFAFTFTPNARLAVGEAGASTVSTYAVNSDGTLVDPKSEPDGQVALCWIVRVGQYYYVSNTGSNTLSGYTITADGQPSLIGTTGVVATTEPGPIDTTSPSGTSFLYAETGSGTVDEFSVNDDGTLTPLGVVDGLPVGIEGIAST